MPLNATVFEKQTNLLGIAQAANTYTDGVFFLLVLIAVYAICFVLFKKYDTKVSFFTTSLIGLVFGIFTFILGLNTEAVIVTEIILYVFALVVVSWRGDVF